jgi:hypothetical protein
LESPRTFELTGNELSVIVDNIVGGREYEIQATVTNETGQKTIARIKTPYIREFENIAPLDDIIIAAFYYDWYSPNYPIPRNLPDKPLLGIYNSSDNVVFNRHVDWATGHGIDVLVFPWFFRGHEQHRIFEKNMGAELFDDIKFSFISTYVDELGSPPYNFDSERTRQTFISNIRYLIENYLNQPNIWKIDNRPVIVIWGSPDRYQAAEGNIQSAIEEVRAISSAALGKSLYIICDDINIFHRMETLDSSDALYHYSPFHNDKTTQDISIDDDVPLIINWMRGLERIAKEHGKLFIPTIAPGFNNKYDYRTGTKAITIYRSPGGFRAYIQNVNTTFRPRIVFLNSFNEWFEGTQVEPTKGYEFNYLEVLKEEF